jgi:hypothetical protein
MTKQITKMMLMLVLAIGLTAGAATAQIKGGGSFAPVGIYTGTETAEGTYDQLSQIQYGDTFVMNSFGEWESYHLTVSLNYSTSQFVPNNFIVAGGTWSLVVVRDNQYAGTLYGEVQSGSVNLTANSSGEIIAKQVQVNLRSNGGLGLFPRKDNETISGVYSATTDLRSKETTGNASFNF